MTEGNHRRDNGSIGSNVYASHNEGSDRNRDSVPKLPAISKGKNTDSAKILEILPENNLGDEKVEILYGSKNLNVD